MPDMFPPTTPRTVASGVPHGFARTLFALTRAETTTVVVTSSAVNSHEGARSLALSMPPPGASPSTPVLAATKPTPRIEFQPLIEVQPQSVPRGQTIQLAAAQSPSEAHALWTDLTSRHPQLLGTHHAVIPAQVGSRKVYRLRTTAPGSHALCSELKRSGTACFNVN
jgi:hypothetical protein